MNNLIRQETNEKGEIIYRMATFDVDVVAKSTGGLSPIIIYLQGEKDITDDIRALRFHYQNPASFIEDYPAFQAMLYEKEQRAINELYESISIKPKTCPRQSRFYGVSGSCSLLQYHLSLLHLY